MSISVRSLLGLPEEIVVMILGACDVESVLTMETTCSALHRLVATRQVWLYQLRRLDVFHAPDFPPQADVRKLSAHSLRNKVLRAVRAYRNWNSSQGPQFSREKIVRLPDHPSFFRHKMPATALIPGGEYLSVFWIEGVLELIDVQTSEVVWMFPPMSCWKTVKVEEFGVEACEDGTLLVLLCLRSASMHLSAATTIFKIDRVDPRNDSVEVLLQNVFHEEEDQFDFVECAKICGDIAVISMTNRICLINWVKGCCVELTKAYFVDCIEIVGSHIICAQHAEDTDWSLVLISVDYVLDSATPPETLLPPKLRGTNPWTARWRRLDYGKAVSQLVPLKLPENSSVITTRLSICTPVWQLQSPRSSTQASTVHFMQHFEMPDDTCQYEVIHKCTLHPGRQPAVKSDLTLSSTPTVVFAVSTPRLQLDARVVTPALIPEVMRTEYGTSLTQSGRAVLACVDADGALMHVAFSIANAERSVERVLSTREIRCLPLELPMITKGYSLEMEAYSGAVVYTRFSSEVVIRYYD